MMNKTVFDQAVNELLDQNDEIRDAYNNQVRAIAIKQMVRSIRKAAGITQVELACRIGSTQSVISRLESSEPGTMPNLDTMIEIAHACNQRLLLGSAPMDTGSCDATEDNVKIMEL